LGFKNHAKFKNSCSRDQSCSSGVEEDWADDPEYSLFFVRPTELEQAMAKEELKWQNIDADDLPATVKKSFDPMVEAEAAFKADLEKLLKNEGHMPEDKYLVMSRKGKRLGVAYASTPRGEGGAASLKFKTK
jgi:hypothetical protein